MTSKAESTPGVGVGSTAADKMDLDGNAAHPGSEKARIESEDNREKNGVLHNAEFWQDLEGFLAQRLNEERAETARRLALCDTREEYDVLFLRVFRN